GMPALWRNPLSLQQAVPAEQGFPAPLRSGPDGLHCARTHKRGRGSRPTKKPTVRRPWAALYALARLFLLLLRRRGSSSGRHPLFALGRLFLFLGLLGLLDHHLDHLGLRQSERTAVLFPAVLIHHDLDPLATGQDIARALERIGAT